MNNRLILLALSLGLVLVFSCNDDAVTPKGDTFEEVIEIGGVVPPATEEYKVIDSEPFNIETDTATWICKTETIEADYAGGGDDGFSLFNPNASVIYPGSMLQGKSLKQGTPDIIAVERAGGVISIDVINGNTLSKMEVDKVSKSAITQAANEIIGNSSNIIPANFQFSMQEIQSERQFAAALKVDFNSSFTDISSDLSFSYNQDYHRFVVVLNQSYYTLSFDIPTNLDGLFAPEVTPQDLSLYVGQGNPATYISDVTYGQIYYMLVESTSSAIEMQAALNASFNGLFASGSVNTEVNYMSSLSNLNIKVFGFGGDARSVLLSIGSTNLSEIKEALIAGTDIRAGKPISYVVRNIYDNSIVSVQLNTKYDVTTCDVYAQPKWTENWHTIYDKMGPVGAMMSKGDLYDQGKIFIFNQEGNQFCISTNNGFAGPFTLNDFMDEITDLLPGNYQGGPLPFQGVGAITFRDRMGILSPYQENIILVDTEGKRFVMQEDTSTAVQEWHWSEPKNLASIVLIIPSDSYIIGPPIFTKVTAIDQVLVQEDDQRMEFFNFFNEGGGMRQLFWDVYEDDEYTFPFTVKYNLSNYLIDEYQFYGSEAVTSVSIGGVQKMIVVNEKGRDYVILDYNYFNDEFTVEGPFKFYQE